MFKLQTLRQLRAPSCPEGIREIAEYRDGRNVPGGLEIVLHQKARIWHQGIERSSHSAKHLDAKISLVPGPEWEFHPILMRLRSLFTAAPEFRPAIRNLKTRLNPGIRADGDERRRGMSDFTESLLHDGQRVATFELV